jgi:hypothetical protein
MKNLSLMVPIFTMFASSAIASGEGSFDKLALELATAVANCPRETQELFREADRFSDASVSTSRPAIPLLFKHEYELTAVKSNDPTGTWSLIIGTLRITKFIDHRNVPQGALGIVTYRCQTDRPTGE